MGFVLGALLACGLHLVQVVAIAWNRASDETSNFNPVPYDFAYEKWLWASLDLISVEVDPDIGRYANESNRDTSENGLSSASEAAFLFDEVKVSCAVFPEDARWAEAVYKTWGRHCNSLEMTSRKLEANSSIGLRRMEPGVTSHFHLICSTLRKVREEEGDDFQWILFAPENTFALIENLRFFVAPKNSSERHYLGHAMRFWGQLYNWNDAGFALSKGAVDALLAEYDSDAKCKAGGRFWKMGDWYLGKNLAALGVQPADTRDHMGRGRFNGYSFKKLLFPGAVSVFDHYWRDSLYLSEDGPHCCSNHAVTFHGVGSPSKMFQLEYLFHHLRPFYAGGSRGNRHAAGGRNGPKDTFLTEEERLKAEAWEKMIGFDKKLMTTPNSISQLMHDQSQF